MFAAISPSEIDPDAYQSTAVHGVAEVGVGLTDGRSRLKHLFQHEPMRALFPKTSEDVLTAVLTNTSGGLVGGDAQSVRITVGEDARALVMAQAAEKIYRSTGADCRIETDLKVERGGWLEWLPQEAILFDGGRLRRNTRLTLDDGAVALAGEMMVFGRVASGEIVRDGLARDSWQVWRDGKLVWADALHMDGDLRVPLDSPSGFAGAVGLATVIVAGADKLEVLRDVLRDQVMPDGVRFGATVVNGLLVVRILADTPLALRTRFAQVWTYLRTTLAGLPGVMPRLWAV